MPSLNRAWSVLSASSTSQKRSDSVTTSTPSCPGSSTPYCTSTARPPCNRSTPTLDSNRRTKRQRRGHLGSDEGGWVKGHRQPSAEMRRVPGASHLSQQPGTLAAASVLARDCFVRYLALEANGSPGSAEEQIG